MVDLTPLNPYYGRPDPIESFACGMFGESEVVLSLHDENEQGRLLKMRTW